MDALDDLWLSEHEQVVVAFDVGVKFSKALPAIIRFAKLMTLDHGAHGAVQKQDALLERLGNFGGNGSGGAGIGHGVTDC